MGVRIQRGARTLTRAKTIRKTKTIKRHKIFFKKSKQRKFCMRLTSKSGIKLNMPDNTISSRTARIVKHN